MCVGQILSMLFKLLNCHHITNDLWVHFYFGEECMGKTMLFSVIGLFIVLIIFSVMFLKLYRMSAQQRIDRNEPLSIFVKYYNSSYYYFEFIILIRRILIALLAMFYNNYYYITIVIIVLLLFLFIQN
eukprot:238211_1